jgi:hypothetical protein
MCCEGGGVARTEVHPDHPNPNPNPGACWCSKLLLRWQGQCGASVSRAQVHVTIGFATSRLIPTPAHQRVVELKRHHLKLVMVAWVGDRRLWMLTVGGCVGVCARMQLSVFQPQLPCRT